MVTRRTRNYKEKKPMTTFGQFILPLTVIMAVALLFFSVKLFFFDSNQTGDIVFTKEEPVKQGQSLTVTPQKQEEGPAAGSAEEIKTEVKLAKPVGGQNEGAQKAGTVAGAAKATDKPSSAVSKITADKTGVPPQTAVKPIHRWDVQIGAFSSKDNAVQLLEKVRSDGYTTYLVEEKKEGAPFYKVRIKNPKTGKDEAVALSKILEKEGYPIFIVEIK